MGYAINRIRCQVLSVSSILPVLSDPGLSASTKLTLQVLLLILLLGKFNNSELIDNKFVNSMSKFFLELEVTITSNISNVSATVILRY